MAPGSHSAPTGPYEGEPRVQVRVAEPADASCVGQLLFDFNTEFDTPTPSVQELTSRFQAMLHRQDVLVLLAEDNGGEHPRTVGFAYLTLRPTPYGEGPVAELEELYVQPECRNRGIGSRLLGQAHEQVRQRSALETRISVDEGDIDARRFYERHGFWNVEPGETSRMLCYVSDVQPLRRT